MPPKSTKTEEEFITSSQLKDRLEQQMSAFRDILQQQECAYKGFVQIIMDPFNKRLDGVIKDVCDLKASLQYSQKDTDELRSLSENLSMKCKEIDKDITDLGSTINNIAGKLDYIENQSRQNNLLFDGVPETEHEKWSDSEDKIRKIMSDNLNLKLGWKEHNVYKKMSASTKDPNKPRGKTSSYAFFVSTCHEEHKKENPGTSVNFAEFSKKCSDRWRTMSAEEKVKFEDLAKNDKMRYDREMKSWHPPKGAKKGKKKRDPNAPKRPPSAFFVFCSDHRPRIKEENPGISIGDIAKKLGELWAAQSLEDRAPHEAKAAKLKEKYEKDVAAYRAKGGSGKSDAGKKSGSGRLTKRAPAADDDDDDDDEDDDDEEDEEEDEDVDDEDDD